MLANLQNPLNLAGRLLIAALFLPAGISKITGFAGTVGYIESVMGLPSSGFMFGFISSTASFIGSVGLSLAAVGAGIAILVEVLGGLALILGYQTRIAAVVLALFTLVASFFFHAYWSVPAEQAFVQQLMFFKNIAVVGGLFVLAAQGAGAWSLDGKRK